MAIYIPFGKIYFERLCSDSIIERYLLGRIRFRKTYHLRNLIGRLLNGNMDYCWLRLEHWMNGNRNFWTIFPFYKDFNYKQQNCKKEGNYLCGKCDPINQLKTANDYNKYYLNK